MIGDLIHRVLSRWGPLVPKCERDAAWAVAAVFEQQVEHLEAEVAWAYEVNAGLMATIAVQDVELSNLKKTGD